VDYLQRIRVTPEKCSGCRICELICAFTKHAEFNPKRSRIRIVKLERFFVDVPVLCQQCLNPSCVTECSVNALKQDKDGIVHVDEELCTGCERCIEVCPFGAISIDPLRNVAIICDFCGGSPACVQWCPTKTLEFSSTPFTSNAVALTAKSLLEKWGIPSNEYEEYFQKFKWRKT
jgi:carbon-monoxide dehydrogenase iron sulfur subunit